MNKESKIYIAGHRGLVGSALLKALKKKGYANFVLRTHSELDLTDTKAVARFFDLEKPEYVFLAAAKVGGIVANSTYRANFIHANLMIQNNVIHNCYEHGVKKLMFLGSTCIYPKNCPQPMKEDALLTGPLEYTNEPYAIAKIAGIKTCESYNIQYGTNFISVMPTNLYGPYDNFDLEKSHVLPALVRKVHLGKALEHGNWDVIRKDLDKLPIEKINGSSSQQEMVDVLSKYGIGINAVADTVKSDVQPVTVEIWGSGNPMREFLWSGDMADACVFLMENRDFKDVTGIPTSQLREHEVRNTHINIGTGEDIAIRDLAELIKKIVGYTGDFAYNTDKPDGTPKKLTDPSKLNDLGWKYSIGLQEGIERVYQWYTDQVNEPYA